MALIDKEKLAALFREKANDYPPLSGTRRTLIFGALLVEGAEEANPEDLRPKGKWEPQEGFDGEVFWRCASCGDEFWFDYDPTEPPFVVKYCSNCGARMEE